MPAKTKESALYVNQVTLARIANRTPKTIIEWGDKHGLPRHADTNEYYLPDFFTWYAKFLTRDLNEIQETLDQSKARLTSVQADLAELELKEKRGLLVPVDEATALVLDTALRLKTRLDSFGRQIVRLIPDARPIWDEEYPELLKELQTLMDDKTEDPDVP